MNKRKIFVISGFSGSGKGTVVKKLLENNSNMSLVRSMTTRKTRLGEKDEYIFVDDEEFLEAQRNGQLLEFNQYENHLYATPWTGVKEVLDKGEIPILEIDSNGYEAVKKHPKLSDCEIISVFLVVSAEELLKRLENRGTEDYRSIVNRLLTAKNEAHSLENYDAVFENCDIDLTVKRVEDYIRNTNRNSDKFDDRLFEEEIDDIVIRLNNTDSLKNLMNYVQRFTDIRDWTRYHTTKDIAIGITNEAAELLQIFRFKSNEQIETMLKEEATREHIKEELGDVLFFLLDMSNHTGFDLGECLLEKIAKNNEKYPVTVVKGKNKKYDEYK